MSLVVLSLPTIELPSVINVMFVWALLTLEAEVVIVELMSDRKNVEMNSYQGVNSFGEKTRDIQVQVST